MRARRWFEVTSWIPLVAVFVVRMHLSRLEGWGAWAAAPLYIPVLVLSAVMGASGTLLWWRERRRGRGVWTVVVATLLAGSFAIWFLVRILAMELARNF